MERKVEIAKHLALAARVAEVEMVNLYHILVIMSVVLPAARALMVVLAVAMVFMCTTVIIHCKDMTIRSAVQANGRLIVVVNTLLTITPINIIVPASGLMADGWPGLIDRASDWARVTSVVARAVAAHVPKSTPGHRHRQGKGTYVGPSLAHLYPEQSEEAGQYQYQRDEEQATAGSSH